MNKINSTQDKLIDNDLKIRKLPKQSRSKKQVQNIYCATQNFIENDEIEISTNKIAKKAGVTIGSLYRYFPNKHSILKSFANYFMSKTINFASKEIDRVISESTSIDVFFNQIVKSIFNEYKKKELVFSYYYKIKDDHTIINDLILFENLCVNIAYEKLTQSKFKIKDKEMLYHACYYCVNTNLFLIRSTWIRKKNFPDFQTDITTLEKLSIKAMLSISRTL